MSSMSRRSLLKRGAALSALTIAGDAGRLASAADAQTTASRRRLSFPPETDPHERTFMAWPAHEYAWPDLTATRANLAYLARTIAEHEPVVMLARPDQARAAQTAVGTGIEVVPMQLDDLWIRDSGPKFVTAPGRIAGIDFNFNGWGDKVPHRSDSKVAREVLRWARIPRIDASIVCDGGTYESDGHGTLVATESSVVIANRNPGKTRDQIQHELLARFGASKMIWFPGLRGHDITDCHIDALVRFTDRPGVVLLDWPAPAVPKDDPWRRVSEQTLSLLRGATDAHGRALEVIKLQDPSRTRLHGRDFLAGYLNFYTINGATIVPEFGDARADGHAAEVLGHCFPDRPVIQLNIDQIAVGDGGIHCSTQHQPRVPR